MVELEEKLKSVYPKWNMDICAKVHGIQELLRYTKNLIINLAVALKEMSGDPQSNALRTMNVNIKDHSNVQ